MARTYVHEPWWVKERSPRWRAFFAEHHHHPHGRDCDLPAYLAQQGNGYVRTRCYMIPAAAGRNIFCGCSTCSGSRWRSAYHRQARVAWRADARDVMKTRSGDRDGLDSPTYRRGGW